MYKFKTLRCSCCNSVMYNLLDTEAGKIKVVNLICEDCKDQNTIDTSKAEICKEKKSAHDFRHTHMLLAS